MTATNHTMTGMLIAAVVPHPLVSLPVALASHLILDALPHYGDDDLPHTTNKFKLIVGCDALVASMVLLLVLIAQPSHWQLMMACGVVAASPDLLWLPYWVAELRKLKKKKGLVSRFLSWIQWGERPWGWVFEISWFVGIGSLLIPYFSR